MGIGDSGYRSGRASCEASPNVPAMDRPADGHDDLNGRTRSCPASTKFNNEKLDTPRGRLRRVMSWIGNGEVELKQPAGHRRGLLALGFLLFLGLGIVGGKLLFRGEVKPWKSALSYQALSPAAQAKCDQVLAWTFAGYEQAHGVSAGRAMQVFPLQEYENWIASMCTPEVFQQMEEFERSQYGFPGRGSPGETESSPSPPPSGFGPLEPIPPPRLPTLPGR